MFNNIHYKVFRKIYVFPTRGNYYAIYQFNFRKSMIVKLLCFFLGCLFMLGIWCGAKGGFIMCEPPVGYCHSNY